VDLTSALRGETFRPFATIIAPGAIGLAPWAALLYTASSGGRGFWDSHPIATGVALFIASLAAGLVFENIGARVEAAIDKLLSRKDTDHDATWRRYLLLTFEKEPVGQRYLRTILFRLKFELGVIGSLVVQLPGWFMFLRYHGASPATIAGVMAAGVVVAYWFFREALDSAKLLAGVRKDLVREFGRRPTA
jgi:hypothetical protein